MTDIDHVGQPVICIRDRWQKSDPDTLIRLDSLGFKSMPKLYGIYHVAGFKYSTTMTYISLKEFLHPTCNVAFAITEFRPLKNKHVEEMLAQYVTQKNLAPTD